MRRDNTLLGNERVATWRGDVTAALPHFFPRWMKSSAAGGRGTRGADFFRRWGVVPRTRRKNFSLVSLTAALFAHRVFTRSPHARPSHFHRWRRSFLIFLEFCFEFRFRARYFVVVFTRMGCVARDACDVARGRGATRGAWGSQRSVAVTTRGGY